MRSMTYMISAAALAFGALSVQAEPVTQLIFLGDSNLDTGRMYGERMTGVHDDGIRPPPNTIADRSSNGTILPEFLVRELGVSQLNFAWGGATSGRINIVARRNMPDIMESGTLVQLEEFEAFLAGYPADPDALYVVFAGSNDLALINKNDQAAIDAAVREAEANIRYVVAHLEELGAERIIVATRTPRPVLSDYDRATDDPDEAGRNDAAGRQLNTAIRSLVANLDAQLEARVELFDAYAIIRDIVEHAEENGFAAYDASEAGYCVSNEDCTGLINHDNAHKTSAVHELLAEAFIEQFDLTRED